MDQLAASYVQSAAPVKGNVHPKAGILTIKFPVEYGTVTNFDDYEKVLHGLFYNELRVAPEEHPLIMVVRPGLSKAIIEKITQILFETFNVPALLLATSAEIALYKSGLFNNEGVIVESGDDLTQIVVIRDGRIQKVTDIRYGGSHVNGWLLNALKAKGVDVKRDMIRHVKESACYVALEPAKLLESDLDSLPSCVAPGDESNTLLRQELFLAPETIFTPQLTGGERTVGLVDEIYDAVVSSAPHLTLERALAPLRNVVLCGGNTWFRGFNERLERDIRAKLQGKGFCKVVANPKQSVPYWRTTPLSVIVQRKFDGRWITVTTYNNEGPTAATARNLGLFVR